MHKFKIITLDLDGTLTPHITERYLLSKIAPDKLDEYERLEKEFEKDIKNKEEYIKKQFELLIGFDVGMIKSIIGEMPLTKNVKKAIEEMKNEGLRVYILTDNPDVFCEALAEKLPIDGYICTETIKKDNKIVGIGKLNLEKLDGLKEFLKNIGVTLDQCIHVGDWLNDIPVFEKVGLGIAFRPKNHDVIKHVKITLNFEDFYIVWRVIRSIILCDLTQ